MDLTICFAMRGKDIKLCLSQGSVACFVVGEVFCEPMRSCYLSWPVALLTNQTVTDHLAEPHRWQAGDEGLQLSAMYADELGWFSIKDTVLLNR